jgi:hypothetical protein
VVKKQGRFANRPYFGMTLTTEATEVAEIKWWQASACSLCALWFLFGRGGNLGRPVEIIPHPL